MKQWDLFPHVPKEFTEKTNAGGCCTILLLFVLAYLTVSECLSFWATEMVSEVLVEEPRSSMHMIERLSITLNITFPKVACHVLSVETQDNLGGFSSDLAKGTAATPGLDVENQESATADTVRRGLSKPKINQPYVKKVRLLPDGTRDKNIEKPTPGNEQSILNYKGEGCEVAAFLYIRKIPGNLHITTYAHADFTKLLYNGMPDLTHTIETFGFGNTDPHLHKHSSSFAPLDEYRSVKPHHLTDEQSISYEYYLKVVPTMYYRLYRTLPSRAWQFTASANSNAGRYTSAGVYFRYDFSPLTVVYKQHRESLAHFIVQLCAITGGFLSIGSLCLVTCHKNISRIIFKEVGGKLG